MIIHTDCDCGDWKDIYVDEDSYKEWVNGKLIQKCFPHMSSDDRERLITGICPECWDILFSEEQEEQNEPKDSSK